MNLANLLSASASRNPRRTAVVIGNESISYEHLEGSTTQLAHWLLRRGARPGDCIALHWPNSIEW
jgi:acyl-CoA synthetase (AMP-forming)/AMP-acid ligase II